MSSVNFAILNFCSLIAKVAVLRGNFLAGLLTSEFYGLMCPRAVRVVWGWRSHLSFTRGLNHDE